MDWSAAKSSFIRREVNVWGSLRSLRTSLAEATARLSQQGAEVADLRLLCTDLRTEAAAAHAEAAAARAEARRQQSEFDRVVKERDQSRGRAAEAESWAETLAVDLAVAQVAASEQHARAGGTPWPSSVFVPACFLYSCLRSFFWLFAELESALDESAKALAEALAGCWNLLSAARRPTRVNGGDNRVTCTGAIALLI
jgi:multidrug efflux pump subunit AcrA (membrane-fusion protein)